MNFAPTDTSVIRGDNTEPLDLARDAIAMEISTLTLCQIVIERRANVSNVFTIREDSIVINVCQVKIFSNE